MRHDPHRLLAACSPVRAPSREPASTAIAPDDERAELETLLELHDLWLAPRSVTCGRERWQSHPEVAARKAALEARFIDRLDTRGPVRPLPVDAVAAMRHLAATDLVPPVYEWLARDATWSQLVDFLAVEGGPDAGFDDLVALAQIGIRDDPKVALAENYWDELGRGELDAVHTVLHDDLVAAVDLPRVPRHALPVSALARAALGGMLATNRWLQPELIGALGLIELQAGPRCRAVVRALRRLGAPAGAFPFYEEHATADPRHGREWLVRVVAPLAADDPAWATGIVRGAWWRHLVNARFFAEVADALVDQAERVTA